MTQARIKFSILYPFLKIKWFFSRQSKIREFDNKRKTTKEIFDRTQEIYQKYLEVNRKQQPHEKETEMQLKGQYDALAWVLGVKDS